MNSLLQPLVITLSLSPHIRAAASVPMCQCGQTVICPRGQIIRIIALEIFEGLKYRSTVLSSSGPGPGPRSGPGQVPGQVQKVQGLRTKDLDLG